MSPSCPPEALSPDTKTNSAVRHGSPALSRRKFLGATGASFLSAAIPVGFMAPQQLHAQSNLTPDEALKALMDGNQRFVSGNITSFEHDLKILKENNEGKQEPFAAVLSCADSRVPVELIFDQTIGHIFVTRVAGNLVTPEIIGNLEYGAAVLGPKSSSCSDIKVAEQ